LKNKCIINIGTHSVVLEKVIDADDCITAAAAAPLLCCDFIENCDDVSRTGGDVIGG